MVGVPDNQASQTADNGVEPSAPRPRQIERPVPSVKGLYVIEYASGRRTYVFRFRSPITKKKNCIVVGDGQMPFTDVVLLVVQIQAQLAKGLQPGQPTMTLGQVFDEILVPSFKRRLKSWRDHVNRFDNHIRPVLGDRPINLITTAELISLVENLSPAQGCRRGITVLSAGAQNRITALIKVIFSSLHARGLISTNPAAPLKCVPERNQRGRVIRPDELKAFFTALESLPEKVKLLMLMMLLTGMRLGEARRACWSQYDPTTRILRLPDSKSGRPRFIPISDECARVIEALRAHKVNDWMFAGKGNAPMAAPYRQFRKLVSLAGTEGLWQHDIRRSFSTYASQTGTPLVSLSRVLGHSHVNVTERYVVTHDEQLHAAVAGVGRHLQHLLPPLPGTDGPARP